MAVRDGLKMRTALGQKARRGAKNDFFTRKLRRDSQQGGEQPETAPPARLEVGLDRRQLGRLRGAAAFEFAQRVGAERSVRGHNGRLLEPEQRCLWRIQS